MECKMKLIYSVITSAFILSGCAKDVIIVRVPVPIPPPQIEMPIRPILGSDQIAPDTEIDTIIKVMMIDFEKMQSYANQLENIVNAFRNASTLFLENKLNTEITVKQ